MTAFLAEIGEHLLKLRTGRSRTMQLARASAWMLAGSVVQQLFAMLASIGTGRILGPADFGKLGIVRSTVLFFAGVAGAGVGVAATRYVAAHRAEDPARAGRIVGLILTVAWCVSATAALLCAGLSGVIATRVFGTAQLALPIAIGAAGIVFSIVGGVQIGVLTGFERFSAVATLLAAEGIVAGALTVAGAWMNGVAGAVLGQIAGVGIVFCCKQLQMMAACRQESVPVTTAGMRAELSILGAFVVPAILLGVATQPAEWLSRVLLARSANGMAEVGLFTVAFSWAQLVLFVPSQLAGPSTPLLTGALAARDTAAFRRLLRHSAGIAFGAAVAVAVPLALLSPLIMRAYGRGFAGGAPALALLALAYAVGAVTMVFRTALFAVEKVWLQNAQVAIAGAVLIGTFLLCRHFGALGLAAGYAAAYVVLVPIQAVPVLRAGR